MKSILIVLLMAGVAWGQDYTSVIEPMDSSLIFTMPALVKDGLYEFKNGKFTALPNPTADKVVQIPRMEDPEKDVLKYKGDGTYEWIEMPGQGNISSTKNMVTLTSPKYTDATFTDLSVCKKICFALPGDLKRCIDTKWLYLLMVTAGIQENCK